MTIAIGEVLLLEAIRDTLRVKLNLSSNQCDIEFDEQPPAIAGQTYICVIPHGLTAGPVHNTAARIHDVVHSVKVTVLQRCGNVPRDRNRSIFANQLDGLNVLIDEVIRYLDWNPNLLSLTNHYLADRKPGTDPFIEMLRLKEVESRPRMVTTELYAAENFPNKGASSYTAMARSVILGGCRRIQNVNQILPDPIAPPPPAPPQP